MLTTHFLDTKSTKSEYDQFEELLDKTQTKYVMFLNEYNTVKNTESLVNVVKSHDENVLTLKLPDERVNHLKLSGNTFYTGGMYPNPLYIGRYIIKTSAAREVAKTLKSFGYTGKFFWDIFIIELLKDTEETPWINNHFMTTTEPIEYMIATYTKPFDFDWYTPYMRELLIPYIKFSLERQDGLTKIQQRFVKWIVSLRYLFNYNGRDKFVLQGEDIDDFINSSIDVLSYIDDKYIIEKLSYNIPVFMIYLFLREKYKKEPKFTWHKEDKLSIYEVNGVLYGQNIVRAMFKVINYEKDCLILEGTIIGHYCMDDPEKDFSVYLNGKEYPWERTEVYNIDFFFGRSIFRYIPFRVTIPVSEFTDKDSIHFSAVVDGKKMNVPISFRHVMATRIVRSRWAYWYFGKHMLSFNGDKLWVTRARNRMKPINEILRTRKLLFTKRDWDERKNGVILRKMFWLTKPFYKNKEIWIYFDKLYKAGDNADYLFRYNMEHHKEVNNYYILQKSAAEYKQMKKEFGRNVVSFGSMRQKVIAMHCTKMYATHAGVWNFCGLGEYSRYIKDLMRGEVYCIQHGLTTQSIAQHQNVLEDNTRKYFCASKYEIQNISQPVYGYTADQLFLTGCPRYDGLRNRDKKQILITPTWRRNIVITGNDFGTAKDYNPEFKNTVYFDIYNRLINDERVIGAAKDMGYKLVFLLHPTISSQIDDFDRNDYAELVAATSDMSYEKILTESSLMVTDYSGIQFDFAYQKKPILYYQPKELPPQYVEGVYKYDTMGFGPIIEDYEECIENLCKYIRNGCQMDAKYIERVDDFFAFTDFNNCKRIMEAVLKGV